MTCQYKCFKEKRPIESRFFKMWFYIESMTKFGLFFLQRVTEPKLKYRNRKESWNYWNNALGNLFERKPPFYLKMCFCCFFKFIIFIYLKRHIQLSYFILDMLIYFSISAVFAHRRFQNTKLS